MSAVEKAEVRKLEAEALFYEESAHKRSLETWILGKEKSQYQASSDAARIYPFYSSVNKGTAAACMGTLSQWYREDPEHEITIVFNSPGGSVIDGLALYDHILRLRASGVRINTESLGYAASMGGVLLQAGERRSMGKHAYMLIHEVSSGAIGNTSELEDELKLTKRFQVRLLDILADRSNLTKRAIARKWKRKDWWISATEALEHEFIDEIAD